MQDAASPQPDSTAAPARGRVRFNRGAGADLPHLPPRDLGRLLDQLPIGIVSLDRERRVRLLNRRARTMLGVRARDVVGTPASALFPGSETALAAALRGERGPRLVRAPRRDGERSLELLVTTVTPPGGEPVTLLLLQDVTARVAAETAMRDSHQLLSAVAESTRDVLFVEDAGGRLLMVNRAGAARLGRAPADCVGASVRDLFDPDVTERMLAADREVMDAGETREFEEHVAPPGGEPRIYRTTRSPYRDQDGAIAGVIGLARDVTEEQRAAERLRVLATAGELLSGSLDYGSTLTAVARAAVPAFADGCLVDVAGPRDGLEPLAVAHADPAWEAAARDVVQRWGPLPVARGGARFLPDVEPSAFSAGAADAEHRAALERICPRGLIVVPLVADGGRALGALTFVSAGRRLDEEDRRLAEELGRRAATAVAHARVHAERSHIARTLQESLRPPRLPVLPGAGVASRFHAAGASHEVGGDFYDLFPLPDGRFLLVIGDVCGKGAEAAAVTALARYTLRGSAMREDSPAQLLRTLNGALIRQDVGAFCSVLCARLEPSAGGLDMVMASGGHPLPLMLHGGGGGGEAGVLGTLLGVVEDPALPERSARLEAGDTAVFYTDGVSEAGAPDRVMAPAELIGMAAPWSPWGPEAVASRLEAAALAAGGPELRDDVALVAVTLPGPAAPERIRVVLPTGPALGRAVRAAVEPLRDRIGRQAFATVRLLVDELVANAERHGTPDPGAPIGLEVAWTDGLVRIAVSDTGPGFKPPRRTREPDGPGGWGLLAVDRLAHRWGVDRTPPATVWAEVRR
jgi:PAS domain S-box-containing protein